MKSLNKTSAVKTLSVRNSCLALTAMILYYFGYTMPLTMFYDIAEESGSFLYYLIIFCRISSLGLALIPPFFDHIQRDRLLGFGIIAVLIAAVALCSNNRALVFFVLLIFILRGVEYERIFMIFVVFQSLLLLITIGSTFLGFIPDRIFHAGYAFMEGERIRHGLGFGFTTSAPIMFLFIQFCWFCLRKDRISYGELLIAGGLDLWFFVMTKTRMTFLVSASSVLFFILYKLYHRRHPIENRPSALWLGAPWAVAAFAVYIHVCYSPDRPFFAWLNRIIGGRLALGKSCIEQTGWSLFGTVIDWISGSSHEVQGAYNYVDCSYMQLLIANGIVGLLIVLFFYTCIVRFSMKKNDHYLFWCVMFILLFSITEPRLAWLHFNPFMLAAAEIFADRNLEEAVS